MAQTTGPILAIGGITVVNRSIFHGQDMDWRIPIATGLAALAFTAAEKAWPAGAQMLAWTALAAVCLTRVDPSVPSPVESALDWWQSGAAGSKTKTSTKTSSTSSSATRAV
ncbi:hypothetical protein ACFRCW_42410 [Streptomyces sp. NPDC056653]|uniref:hypothetical protein n=1 Tax=Streptomyces sp. NPDC056653 TaxID=3345894 RepID=UPI00367E16EE